MKILNENFLYGTETLLSIWFQEEFVCCVMSRAPLFKKDEDHLERAQKRMTRTTSVCCKKYDPLRWMERIVLDLYN